MREIKFRAWGVAYGEENKVDMRYSDKYPDLSCFFNLAVHDRYANSVMQYTGQNDKVGKGVYEGDILCVLEDAVVESIDGYNRYEKEGDFMEVVFDLYGRWAVKGNAMVDGELLHDMIGDAEVIGNIHENPELLT